MSDGFIAVIVLSGLAMAGAIGVMAGRLIWYGGWATRGVHTCGHVAPISVRQTYVCPKCGDKEGWRNVVCREVIPFVTTLKESGE